MPGLALRTGDQVPLSKVVGAFLAAYSDPELQVHIDQPAARPGLPGERGPREIRGARNWAKGAVAFSQMGGFAQAALVDGSVGIVFAPDSKLSRVLRFTIANGRIVQAAVVRYEHPSPGDLAISTPRE